MARRYTLLFRCSSITLAVKWWCSACSIADRAACLTYECFALYTLSHPSKQQVCSSGVDMCALVLHLDAGLSGVQHSMHTQARALQQMACVMLHDRALLHHMQQASIHSLPRSDIVQVPRAAQSASAFALGFFGRVATVNSQQPSSSSKSGRPSSSSGDGVSSETLGCWPQPVAVNMLPKKHDPVLRFFECCHGYRQHEDRAMRWLVSCMGTECRRGPGYCCTATCVKSCHSRLTSPLLGAVATAAACAGRVQHHCCFMQWD